MLGFRVWDSREKRMIEQYSIASLGFSMNSLGDLMRYGDLMENEYWIPMQSTGLRDFHGIAIFEKDILMWRFDRGHHYVVQDIPNFLIHIIGKNIKVHENYQVEYIKVGNIFENPDIFEELEKIENEIKEINGGGV